MAMIPVALTVAGSDPSGGAGIQADLKTFHQHGVYGTSVIALLTVQNTCEVRAVHVMPAEWVAAQLDAVLEDIAPQAIKTGALGSAEVIEVVADRLARSGLPLVVDPVMVSKHGQRLILDEAVTALRERLLPAAWLVTPNLSEAEVLANTKIHDVPDMEKAAAIIAANTGARSVLVKGGHLSGAAVDVLWTDGHTHHLTADRVSTRHTHGTGCVLSAAITAHLAAGKPIEQAVHQAKDFVRRALATAPGLGFGVGPLNLHAPGAVD